MPSLAKPENVCNGCRTRKKKCEGTRPSCSACLKRGEICLYGAPSSQGVWSAMLGFVGGQGLDPSFNGGFELGTGPLGAASEHALPQPLHSQSMQNVQRIDASLSQSQSPAGLDQAQRSSGVADLASLPDLALLLELADLYFRKLYQYIPIVHKCRFLADLRSKGPLGMPQPLMFAMCTVAASAHHDPLVRERQSGWYEAARLHLTISMRSPLSALQTLQAAALVMYQAIRVGEYATFWLLLGEAWRKAVAIGCAQLDGRPLATPHELGEKINKSWIDKEECRRTIWSLYIFDRGHCTLDLGLAIEDRRLRVNLPMTESEFESLEEPEVSLTSCDVLRIDNFITQMQNRTRQGSATLHQYIILAYALLGRIGDELYSPGFDYEQDQPRLDALSGSLVRLRLILPRWATELSAADPREFTLVIWLNAILSASAVFLYHRPLQDGESLNDPSGMSRDWPHCVSAARNAVALVRDMCKSSTEFASNPFLVPVIFTSSRMLMIEYCIPAVTSVRDASLRDDLELLMLVFRQFKECLGGIGQKYLDGFVFYITQSTEQAQKAKTGNTLDMLRPCDQWTSYVGNEEVIIP